MPDKKEQIYEHLSANLPKEAIEHASKDITRKGYDTTGYQYQYVVDRLNEVLGIEGWRFSYKVLKEIEGKWSTGKAFFDITTEISLSIGAVTHTCIGGHKSETYADALKGAITNGFKKTAAFFGVGAAAYRGTLDEDYRSPEKKEEDYVPKQTARLPKPNETNSVSPPSTEVDGVDLLGFEDLFGKVKAAAALPHLQNIWQKYKNDIRALTKGSQDLLLQAKDAKKAELSNALKLSPGCVLTPDTCGKDLRDANGNVGCEITKKNCDAEVKK